MLEQILFGSISVPGEMIRLILAFAGVAIAAYYDLFNKKNIPDSFLYGFLAIAIISAVGFNLVEPGQNNDLLAFTFAVAIFLSLIGYVFYRVGQIGGADVIIIAAVALLVPLIPSLAKMPFNVPFVIPVMIFAGLVFGIYAILRFGMQALVDGAKPKLIYLILLVPLVLFAYVYMSSPLYSPVYLGIIVLLLLATIFFMMYKEDINMMLAEELPIDQLEPEDVVAFEMMDRATVKKLDMKRVLTPEEIGRLRKAGLASVWVYTKLPPFIPFLLIGMILSLFFSNLLFGF